MGVAVQPVLEHREEVGHLALDPPTRWLLALVLARRSACVGQLPKEIVTALARAPPEVERAGAVGRGVLDVVEFPGIVGDVPSNDRNMLLLGGAFGGRRFRSFGR